ncbi:MAG: DUF4136 domain-containing protein [Polaromonas sp.]|uniref:DUF4136 domain-containing protein n=1 Tax=Polaromonas sp. TaxID=1869339 RepID=UPI002734D893|nr:DUF4136 domain-containing protein [Polaromonas sp.]MDP2816878.1 DUF4136 domain-containing protein [Polaromonas sp.]
MTTLPRLRVWLAVLVATLLTACASPIVTQVSNFNQWPSDATGSSFTFIKPPSSPSQPPPELELATYQAYAQQELEKLGLRRAPTGQAARLLVELGWITQPQDRTYRQPIYDDRLVFYPPYRNAAGQVFPGYWAPSRFGPAYLGDRLVAYTVQFNQINLRILDKQGSPPGQPRAVFESHAVYEGQATLPTMAAYLVRAVFDGFPGQNGQVRRVNFDRETGAVIRK